MDEKPTNSHTNVSVYVDFASTYTHCRKTPATRVRYAHKQSDRHLPLLTRGLQLVDSLFRGLVMVMLSASCLDVECIMDCNLWRVRESNTVGNGVVIACSLRRII